MEGELKTMDMPIPYAGKQPQETPPLPRVVPLSGMPEGEAMFVWLSPEQELRIHIMEYNTGLTDAKTLLERMEGVRERFEGEL